MNRLKRVPSVGPLLTGLFLLLLLVLNYEEIYTFSLAPVFLLLVFSTFLGGFRYGLISAGLIIVTEAYLLLPAQILLFFTISFTLLCNIWLIHMLWQRAQVVDSVNGNITNLLRIMYDLQDLLEDWDISRREQLRKQVRDINHQVINLTTKVKGWHDIRREMEQTQAMARSDAEARRGSRREL